MNHSSLLKTIYEFKNLRKIWPYIKPWKKFLYAAMLLVPLILSVHTAIPFVLKETIDRGVAAKDPNFIFYGSAFFLGLVLLEYILKGSQTLLMAVAVHRMIKKLRTHLVDHTLHLPARYHDKALSGALVTRATSDFDNLSDSLNQGILNSVVDFAVVIGTMIGLFILNWRLALVTLVVLPIVLIIVLLFSRALKKAMLAARAKISVLNAFTQECLYGITTIKLLGAEQSATKRVKEQALDYRNSQMRSVILDSVLFAILDGIASITIGIFLWVAVSPFINPDEINLSVGMTVAFVTLITNLFDPLKQLGNRMAMLQGMFTSVDRIFSVLEVEDREPGNHTLENFSGAIRFRDVFFRYTQDKTEQIDILKGISFEIPDGTSLAIVGPTGSGKSTIIKLIAKLYYDYRGSITIDDQELQNLSPEAIRSRIAIVPQEITLFQGSIEFNISLGINGISREDVIRSAQLVGAHDFIQALPGGYDYKLGYSGIGLSQGQKQLLVFARALAKNPALIILDEATASIDPQSESQIQDAIEKVMKDRTVVVIAHRLSTIENCDNIIVLKEGLIHESGSHQELKAQNSLYSSMLRNLNH